MYGEMEVGMGEKPWVALRMGLRMGAWVIEVVEKRRCWYWTFQLIL
jgi:hypothetical protein